MKSKISKKILLYRVQTKKDPESFTALYDLYVKKIYRFIYFKVSNHEEAEDITSEVFLQAWNYINEGNKVESFSGLLYRIARNKIIDLYRQKKKIQKQNIEEIEERELSDQGDFTEEIITRAEVKEIMQSLHKLKQEYQEVITLKYIDELTTAEIGEITNKGSIAVRVTLHRALKKLKDIMEE